MDERERSQIELIIAHELDLAQRATVLRGAEIYASHSALGRLGSGATVRVVSSAIGETTQQLLADLIQKVGEVSKGPTAFELIEGGIATHFANVEGEVGKSASMASRRGPGQAMPGILKAATDLFDIVKTDIAAKLEIARFDFEDTKAMPLPGRNTEVARNMRNRGGKPLGAHWDEMWADIAVDLWHGDLKPKKQKHITEAMFDWLTTRGIDAGQTAVTDRARALWLKLEPKLRG